LYRDAPLLIADEPTAAMDARAEHAAFQSGGYAELFTLQAHAYLDDTDQLHPLKNPG
jgi:hypothetical protein